MVYARFSAVIPQPIIKAFGRQLLYLGMGTIDERKFTGFVFIYGALLAVGIALNAQIFFGLHIAIGFPIAFLGFVSVVYLWMKVKSEAKGKFVESILPDALQIIASNMKSGLTTERALFVAGRPEFGPLQDELKMASKRISAGERVEVALRKISERINSDTLEKTVWLISEGIKSGGQISDLLFQLSDDLKDQQNIQQEISSNVSIYILLILFAAIFGAPLLFGISSFIVQVLSAQLSTIPTIAPGSLPASGNLRIVTSFVSRENEPISADFVVMFSMVALMVTTVFSSLTIGVINSGKESNGLKYLIPLAIAAFIVFFAARTVLAGFFGNLI
ncbi:MAG: type II secretion system F family protein [archaeon]